MAAETKRVAVRRYELMKEQVEIMRQFCNGQAARQNADLYAIYHSEWARCLDKMYALYGAAFERNHPDLF